MNIPPEWAVAIDDYVASQRAAGYPVTTQRMRREHLQYLARRIPCAPWQVTSDQLVEWAAAQPWSPSTRRSRRTTIQSFYRWAKATGRRKGNPSSALPKVRQGRPKPRPMPARVYLEAKVRGSVDEQLWLELAYDHGMRRTEIALVHSRDLVEDLIGWSLIVHGKGSIERVTPLTPGAARKLRDRPAGYAFPGDDEGHISPRWLGKRVNRLLEGEWTMHAGRHAAGTRWNIAGGLLVAQKLLGHASVATTQIYCEVPNEQLRETLLATAS
jgi:integrase/recombinase XerC